MKCLACEEKFSERDKYKLECHFDDPICENCWDEYKHHLVEAEDWISLHEWDDKEIKEFTITKEEVKK